MVLSFAVNTAGVRPLFPSVTEIFAIESDGIGSLSRIVTNAVCWPIVAPPVALESCTRNCSSFSNSVSSIVETVNVFDASASANVSVPVVAV